MSSRAFSVVDSFEEALAEYAGSRTAVVVQSGTAALFLSCVYQNVGKVFIPARTYISVPSAIIHAGGQVGFQDYEWQGAYWLDPYPILDSALRLQRDMYHGGYVCLSFHARKHLKIGRGGAILTDDLEAADWFRKARFDGRTGSIPFAEDQVEFLGWNMYMTPEQAARGLQLLEALPDLNPDISNKYPDLRTMPVFSKQSSVSAYSVLTGGLHEDAP